MFIFVTHNFENNQKQLEFISSIESLMLTRFNSQTILLHVFRLDENYIFF